MRPEQTIERARKEVADLCTGKRRWTMSIPTRPNEDSDCVIADALGIASDAVVELRNLEAQLALAERMAEALERAEVHLESAAALAMDHDHALYAEDYRLARSACRAALAAYRATKGETTK